MAPMPHEWVPEHTLGLSRDGYEFIAKHCDRLGTDVFQTRLLLESVICMRGEDAAQLFYDENYFVRGGAAPARALDTLFGRGGVQGLDGAAHRARKRMFMSLMTPERIRELIAYTNEYWLMALDRWREADRIVLYEEVGAVLCQAVCAWAGVPLPEAEVRQRTAEFKAMIESAGTVGQPYRDGKSSRNSSEAWITDVIMLARAGRLPLRPDGAVSIIATHMDAGGKPLDDRVAAVELINVLRPTVAVARYIVFAALALHENPECRQNLLSGVADYPELFVQEVRRYYPFFPFVVARVREDFKWRGIDFKKGTRTLLDLYGTNHDRRLWRQPEVFQPERFVGWVPAAYALIPQGGGDHFEGHRCAGEWITIELVKKAVDLLLHHMHYEVPEQDLSIRLSRMPTLPESGFVVAGVRGTA